MPILTKPPEWHNPGSEPPANKKQGGWEVDERPPAGWFNWLFHRIYQSLLELAGAIEDHTADRENPHEVIPGQIGAETPAGAQAKADAAAAAAEAVAKSYADSVVSEHANRTDNPHHVQPSQLAYDDGAAQYRLVIVNGQLIREVL